MTERVAPPPLVADDKWTYERYLRETAEGEYFTIIAGEKIVSPSPTDLHQVVSGNLYRLLANWVSQTRLLKIRQAPYDVTLAEDVVVQPDIFLVLKEHSDRFVGRNFRGTPDLVIEVLSPGSVKLDREKKRTLYAQYAVPEYWIVSPGDRTLEIFQLQGNKYELGSLFEENDTVQSALMPNFSCSVTDLFAD